MQGVPPNQHQQAFDAFLDDDGDEYVDAASSPPTLQSNFNNNPLGGGGGGYPGGGMDQTFYPPPANQNFSGAITSPVPAANVNPPPPASYGTRSNNVKQPLWKRMLSCFTVDNYRPYFDVDTVDVQMRIYGSIRYFNEPNGFWDKVLPGLVSIYDDANANNNEEGGAMTDVDEGGGGGLNDPKLQSMNVSFTPGSPGTRRGAGGTQKGPDAYGPFWIATTLIFVIAVTSNLSKYLNRPKDGTYQEDFTYDVSLLGHAVWIIYIFSFGVPILLCLAFYCLFNSSTSVSSTSPTKTPTLLEVLCLYGYGLLPFVLGTFLCGIVPVSGLQWLFLLAATGVSMVFVLRNMVGFVMGDMAQASGAGVLGGLVPPGMTGGGGGSESGAGGDAAEQERMAVFVHSQRTKAGPILGIIMTCHLIFLLVLKGYFYSHHRR